MSHDAPNDRVGNVRDRLIIASLCDLGLKIFPLAAGGTAPQFIRNHYLFGQQDIHRIHLSVLIAGWVYRSPAGTWHSVENKHPPRTAAQHPLDRLIGNNDEHSNMNTAILSLPIVQRLVEKLCAR